MKYLNKLNIRSTNITDHTETVSHQSSEDLKPPQKSMFALYSCHKTYTKYLIMIFMTLNALGCEVEGDHEDESSGVVHDHSCYCERSDYTRQYVLASTKRCGTVDYIPYHYTEDESYEDEIERIMINNDQVLDCIESSLEQGIAFQATIAHEGADSSLSTMLIMTDDQVMYKAYSDSNICGGDSDCSAGCGASVNVAICEAPSLTTDRRVTCTSNQTVATCNPEGRY